MSSAVRRRGEAFGTSGRPHPCIAYHKQVCRKGGGRRHQQRRCRASRHCALDAGQHSCYLFPGAGGREGVCGKAALASQRWCRAYATACACGAVAAASVANGQITPLKRRTLIRGRSPLAQARTGTGRAVWLQKVAAIARGGQRWG